MAVAFRCVRSMLLLSFVLVLFTVSLCISYVYGAEQSEDYSDEIIAVVEKRPITRSLVKAVMRVFEIESFDEALEFTVNAFVVLNYVDSVDFRSSESEQDDLTFGRFQEMVRRLTVAGMSYEEYRDFIRARRFADQIFIELIGGPIVTEQDMKKFYDQNEQEIRKRFEKRFVYYREVKGGTGHSDLRELGWVRRGELRADFDEVIFSLPTTGFSSHVTADGSSFVFLVAKIHTPTFAELKDDLAFREFYIKNRYKEVFETWLESQKRKQKVKRKK